MSKFILENCPKNENGHWMAKTRDGRDVVIFTDKALAKDYSLVGEFQDTDGSWSGSDWTSDGIWYTEDASEGCMNLISPPPKKTLDFWVNVYEDGTPGSTHRTKGDADACASSGRTACVHIVHEYTPGEGV